MEQWKVIEDFSDYAVSNYGRVKRIINRHNSKAGRILKPRINTRGYLGVVLCKNKKQISKLIHRLVLKAFYLNYDETLQCNHKNCDKTDNRIENLEMVNNSENIIHAIRNGLLSYHVGEIHPMAKLKDGEIWLIKKLLYYKNNGELNITHKKISKMFKVSRTTITDINNKKHWAHIVYDHS